MRLLKDTLARRGMGLVTALPGLLVLLIVIDVATSTHSVRRSSVAMCCASHRRSQLP